MQDVAALVFYTKQKPKPKDLGFGAANQSRTDDLMLTKHVLYQLSHSSVNR